MAESDEEDGISLSQNEIDSILADVRVELREQTESIPSVELSQTELDALFTAAKVPKKTEKPFERPKQISILAGRTKWTQNDIERFTAGEQLAIDALPGGQVEILSDGHFLAKGRIVRKNRGIFIAISQGKDKK